MSEDEILKAIRGLAAEPAGLFRVHRAHPHLYARARRRFGSWSRAVRAAGLAYDEMISHARRRSRLGRAQRPRAAEPGDVAAGAPAPSPGREGPPANRAPKTRRPASPPK